LKKCQDLYTALTNRQKADTHRNALAEAKTFCRWLVEQKLLRSNPIETVKPIGKRSYGKETLTHDKRSPGCARHSTEPTRAATRR